MVFKTDYSLMQVQSIAELSAILWTFIKLPFAIKALDLPIFEWSLQTGFTVLHIFQVNGTACAVPRTVMAICEHFQEKVKGYS